MGDIPGRFGKLIYFNTISDLNTYSLSGEDVDDNLVDENDMKKSKLATDISTLRQSVVKLTCENTKLKEDCLLVRKDLQTAMLKNDESAVDSESMYFSVC